MSSDGLGLQLGTAKIDITPLHPVPLAGFESRKDNFEGVLHPLYARILLFEQVLSNGKKEG
ncbi:hypothetical protein [Bacillus timonensis]|uniref:hypothetical protein n=1 Tax=Bacillus timonensis TaxID=1033734 RepID=UPI0002887F45|nr:hypothetical protein [Bacillus timonensis]